jgi:hypothetical protein
MTQLFRIGICCTLLALAACAPDKSSERSREAPIQPSAAPAQTETPQSSVMLPPATIADVREAVQRVFGDDLARNQIGAFITGDFDGDRSQDLAVIVRPNSTRLRDLNNPLANWIVEDPARAYLPPQNQSVVHLPPKPPVVQVRRGEPLLAIIHGYGPGGWRDPQARQAYLLKNGSVEHLRLDDLPKELMTLAGVAPGERNVIAERVQGRSGFLFWTGATYAWHPL